MPKTGEVTSDVKMIASGFSDVVAIGSIGGFIYVADSEMGFYAIEAYLDDEFSEPRPISIIESNVGSPPKPIAMVVFMMGGVMNATASVAAFAMIVIISLF